MLDQLSSIFEDQDPEENFMEASAIYTVTTSGNDDNQNPAPSFSTGKTKKTAGKSFTKNIENMVNEASNETHFGNQQDNFSTRKGSRSNYSPRVLGGIDLLFRSTVDRDQYESETEAMIRDQFQRLVVMLPKDQIARLKIYCAAKDRTVKEVMNELVNNLLKQK
jgi:hypothetical protein